MLFAPIMGAITFHFGWHYVYITMGVLGILLTFVWLRSMTSPDKHPRVNAAD